jgi:hypothetical protein
MYIGSTAKHGGALALRYDFTRAFPMAPLPGSGTFIGTDPAFNAQVTDDPSQGIYRLRNGTRPSMEIIGLDPAVSVDLNGTTLKTPGAHAAIGRMPYLHQHPQWKLTVPDGTVGDFSLSFRVTASHYAPSAVYTATLRVLPPATTTTTIPSGGGSCTPAACDDRNPCTVDRCDGDVCVHVDAVDSEAVFCRLTALTYALDGLPSQTGAGHRMLVRLYRIIDGTQKVLQKAVAGQRADKMIARAEKQLNRFAALIDQGVERSFIPGDAGDTLRTLAGDVYDRVVLMESAGG